MLLCVLMIQYVTLMHDNRCLCVMWKGWELAVGGQWREVKTTLLAVYLDAIIVLLKNKNFIRGYTLLTVVFIIHVLYETFPLLLMCITDNILLV